MSSNPPDILSLPQQVARLADLAFGPGNWEHRDEHLHVGEQIYPLVDGKIPVLMQGAEDHLTRTFLDLEEAQITLQQAAQELRQAHFNQQRKAIMQEMAQGYEHNARILQRFRDQVRPFLSFDSLLKNRKHADRNPYIGDFSYLRRDWSGAEAGENELSSLLTPIRAEIARQLPQGGRALVLGAGCGRLAWELGKDMDQVVAVDNSLTMAQQYIAATEGQLDFYGVYHKNIRTPGHFVMPYTASAQSLSQGSEITHPPSISYFVGDVKDLPLPDQSFSLILSAYFTDVLPLQDILGEIRRLLRPGGIFMHFGPLEYHFSEVGARLSMQELQDHFEAKGFSRTAFSQHETLHLASDQEITARYYNNWFVAFRKEEETAGLSRESILHLPEELRFEIKGSLSNEGEESQTDLILPGGKRFEGADSVLDILREVHSGRSAKEVVAAVMQAYGLSDAESEQAILAMLQDLYFKGALAVKA